MYLKDKRSTITQHKVLSVKAKNKIENKRFV